MFAKLPANIQALARAAFQLFRQNPDHPSLRRHPLADTRKGRHQTGSFAVSIDRRYRAIYVVNGDTNVWYWIGSHSDYNNFIGAK